MNKTNIVGREEELGLLREILNSKKAEFIAVYGRRRVGKTYLIRSFFLNQSCLFFQVSGIQHASTLEQLTEFKKELQHTFYSSLKTTQLGTPKNWLQAFEMLNEAIALFGQKEKAVLFFDEFPWMAVKKDKLLQALDYYWNRHWSMQKNIKLIICGSAASWVIENILNSQGGLHNRVTRRMPISPFTLQETKDYLERQGIHYHHYQLLQLYLCIGGIPYYLEGCKKGLSSMQNINQLCFQKKGSLLDEFHNLFTALFSQGGIHEAIIRLIATKREGINREQIETELGIKGGTLTLRLRELEQAGFIIAFTPWGKTYGIYYKIIDEYTLFYLTWIEPAAKSGLSLDPKTKYWEEIAQTPAWKAWAGYAFEMVCYKHVAKIKKALRIPEGAIATTWRYIPSKRSQLTGAQIDLLFERHDHLINICEIKHTNAPFRIDKEYAAALENKRAIYQAVTKTQKQIVISMITTFGLKESDYANDLIFSSCTLEDLFDS